MFSRVIAFGIVILFATTFAAAEMSTDTEATFLSPACIDFGETYTFSVQVDYVADAEAIILAQYQIGYDWTYIEGFDPGTISVPGSWIVANPNPDIVAWLFDAGDGFNSGGVLNGETIVFSLEAQVGFEPDDNEVTVYLYGDEAGGVPPHELIFQHTFDFCPTTTTTTSSTTTTTTTTTSTTTTTTPSTTTTTT
ncbi:hypothetical protein K8I61_01595 [bacterium]|nr:hypothetical protein [bacterium]